MVITAQKGVRSLITIVTKLLIIKEVSVLSLQGFHSPVTVLRLLCQEDTSHRFRYLWVCQLLLFTPIRGRGFSALIGDVLLPTSYSINKLFVVTLKKITSGIKNRKPSRRSLLLHDS